MRKKRREKGKWKPSCSVRSREGKKKSRTTIECVATFAIDIQKG